ncbi:MAG: DUF434 domain-containing protein [Bacteroidales bacterium]|nr:DUF434 domain-containing protein [Bacteroidales bacterium]
MREIVNDAFRDAAGDYFWLLNRNYPQRLVYKTVCDRYKLNTLQRVILYRGIFPAEIAALRLKKRIEDPKGYHLWIDVFNVLFKISSYLSGRPVFICNDGLLRDAGDAFEKQVPTAILERSVNLMLSFLRNETPKTARFLIDQPVDNSSLVKEMIHRQIMHLSCPAELNSLYPADKLMSESRNVLLATADSEIIDRSGCLYYDLAFKILQREFSPAFLSFPEILAEINS